LPVRSFFGQSECAKACDIGADSALSGLVLLHRQRRIPRATVPPRVDYRLTPLGASLGEALCGVWVWSAKHGKVEHARHAYDEKLAPVRRARVPDAA
jgi:hypothetical protein